MSSTLYGRGSHTQVGLMHRAETINREISEIRALLVEVQKVPELIANLMAEVSDLKTRLNEMGVPQLNPQPPISQEQIDELATKIEALRVLQAPQVTAASLQALERRLEIRIAAALSQ